MGGGGTEAWVAIRFGCVGRCGQTASRAAGRTFRSLLTRTREQPASAGPHGTRPTDAPAPPCPPRRVLGCLLPGLVITEKECVEKTYPEYWDHLRLRLSARLVAADSHPEEAAAPRPAVPHCVLIGMRAAGAGGPAREAGGG